MKENIHQLESFILVGISTRTTNAAEMTGAGETPKLWQRFYSEGVIQQIPGALRPGEIIAAYTDFESDDTGPYTLIIGAAVRPGTKAPAGMALKEVRAARYLRVGTERGRLAEIGVAAWVKIWQDQPLRNERAFECDLEIYGAAAANPEDAQFDIYLGLK
jgi:predicted transcriptional regulator YdeE